jgi:type IV pilus assembly protein PilB
MLEDRQLSSLFIRKGLLDEATVQRAMALCESTKSSLYAVLLEHDLVNEEKAIVAVSKQLNLGCVSLKEFKAEPRILELVPSTLAERLQLMPLGLTEEDGERKLYLAMANPLDIDASDEVGRISGFTVVPLLAGPIDVATAR